MTHADPSTIQAFIDRWQASGAAERANFQQFAAELCDVLDLPRPSPQQPHDADNSYVFEKRVPRPHGATGFIDLYKRGCFVLEAKQGSDKPDEQTTFSAAALRRRKKRKQGTAVRGTAAWDTAMERAKQQAQSYARSLPVDVEGDRPPFLLIVDVGNTIELYSEFTRTGGNYVPFPDPGAYRLTLDDLHDSNVRLLLRQVWTDPMSLDPSRRSARVTREIANRLALLARALESDYSAEDVAHFLMRCLFTMFAEDVGLLPERSFTELLDSIRHDLPSFKPLLEDLWQKMDTGGYSVLLRKQIPRFNGSLFAERTALPLTADQLQLLVEAAQADWRDVEPAIFGTLLERALDARERHKLGAHYTPRAYVERLVQPTIIEPLREEWDGVKAAALLHADDGEEARAVAEVDAFQQKLAGLRVLDPACGSGNFLYVTLELLKRLEAEVLDLRQQLGAGQLMLDIASVTVTPNQFLGIEVNPRAAAIAELVLWIGYLQWQLRSPEKALRVRDPIIEDYHNIECRDAVLAWDAVAPLLDADGAPVTRWDGRTTKPHPVTGEEVPDETARIPAYTYTNPRPAAWPTADYIVGNPPFIGTARMRDALGDGYAEAIRAAYPQVPASCDYVMYWWERAAELLRAGEVRRFGLITTNSLRQTFNRRVLQRHMDAKNPLSLTFAIPDHPWVDSGEGAAVRIAMTVAEAGDRPGVLRTVLSESKTESDEAEVILTTRTGKILPELSVGARVSGAVPLKSNSGLSNKGFEAGGADFIITRDIAYSLGLNSIPGLEQFIRPSRNGRDITTIPQDNFTIDLYGLELEQVKTLYPEVYQWLYQRVKPLREQNRDPKLRRYWWLHRRLREDLRLALSSLSRFIITVETSKHRFFTFMDKSVSPSNLLIVIASDDAYQLGMLSSRIHVVWALASGGRMGLGNDPRYNKKRCFETFPFPDPTADQKATIRELGEQLDAHRKRQQALHPDLTLTDMYNVLEKVRAGDALSAKERRIYDHGLIAILQQLHDDLDTAVAAAYGWPADLPDEDILERLVALNAARAAEEAAGHVRWLRPEYQAPDETPQARQAPLLDVAGADELPPLPADRQPWPPTMAAQATAVRQALLRLDRPAGAPEVAALFDGKPTPKRVTAVEDILETLVALGQAQATAVGVYATL